MSVVATLAICAWPIAATILYLKLSLARATLWNFVAAQMILPTAVIKLPMILSLDKATIPTLCALIGVYIFSSKGRRRPALTFRLETVLILLYVLSPLISSLANSDTLMIGAVVLPGVGVYDGLSGVEQTFIAVMPFVLGRQLLRTSQSTEDVLRTMAIAGLIYSLPMLFELRMSPSLHYWIYGFYSTDFIQEMRGDGFRPMVFMGHGLVASFFMMWTAVAAAALWRIRSTVNAFGAGPITGYLSVVLILCKSLGALIYGIVAVPLVRFASPKVIASVALLMGVISLGYPLLRAEGVVPATSAVSTATIIDGERADSLETRFRNEDQLLERASQRLWLGWGRYGRNRIYDPDTGKDISVTDGHWILTLGQFGIMGFLAEFGLLTVGIFRVRRVLGKISNARESFCLSTMSLMVALSVVDLLPNSFLTPVTFLLAGSLVGRTENLVAHLRQSRRVKSSMQIGQQASGVPLDLSRKYKGVHT
jgi:hypothetical protein